MGRKVNRKADEKRRRKIRAKLIQLGVNQTDIARRLGIRPCVVFNVVAGRDSSRRVVQALIESGVPESYFRECRRKKDGKQGT